MSTAVRVGGMTLLQFASQFSPKAIQKVWCTEDHLSQVKGLYSGGRPQLMSAKELSSLLKEAGPSDSHGGVVVEVKIPNGKPLEELISNRKGVVLALDHLQDVQNVGAILRSAALLGALGTLLPEVRSAALGPGMLKASAGTLLLGQFSIVTNLARTLRELKELNFWIVGLEATKDPAKALPVTRLHEFERLCLVVGAEHGGLRPTTQDQCDALTTLSLEPAYQTVSLNASVAAALALSAARMSLS